MERRMNAPESAKLYDPGLESTRERADLLASSGDDAPKTQIIAIYGKGGIGKSFTLANLSYMMAQQGKKVLLIGCDPKSDTTSLLFGGKACPTIIETASAKKAAGDEVSVGDVCFKRDGVFAMELGGPEVGRGCGGCPHGGEELAHSRVELVGREAAVEHEAVGAVFAVGAFVGGGLGRE